MCTVGRQPATSVLAVPTRGGEPGVARRPKERVVRVRIPTLALSTPLCFFGAPVGVGMVLRCGYQCLMDTGGGTSDSWHVLHAILTLPFVYYLCLGLYSVRDAFQRTTWILQAHRFNGR